MSLARDRLRRAFALVRRPGIVFYASIALVSGFVALGVTEPELLAFQAGRAYEATTTNFGWMYLFVTTAFIGFCLFLALTRFGRVRLGQLGEEPEFPFGTWLGMIFSCGMGVGLVFWGVAEPLTHFDQPPMGIAEPRSADAARVALRYAVFHWGFHQWASFAVVGLAIAYVRFRRGSKGLISECFRPLIGGRVDGAWGKAIDVLAVLATTVGVATTLGLGTLQINSGLSLVAGVPYGAGTQLQIIAGVGLLFTLSAVTPLEKGLRFLSDLNMLLAAALLLFVFFTGPTPFITAAMTNTVGEYLSHVVGMSLAMTPFTGDDWIERWTIFYWAWGLSWAPFVGSFIARISRGRTIREFAIGVIVVPAGLSILWFATFGGTALYFDLFQGAGLADAARQELPRALFATLARLPMPELVSIAALVLIALFVVTSANSATFVLGMFTSRGSLDPGRLVRVVWGGLQLGVASVLLMGGGLEALQTLSIVAGFPFMVLMVFMAIGLYRGLYREVEELDLQDLAFKRRLEALLAESDAARSGGVDPDGAAPAPPRGSGADRGRA
jgi:glycine betaine transporter